MLQNVFLISVTLRWHSGIKNHEIQGQFSRSKKPNLSRNKNGIPFHDRKRITNFQNCHENSNIPNRKVRRKENIPIRQRKIFQLEKGKNSN